MENITLRDYFAGQALAATIVARAIRNNTVKSFSEMQAVIKKREKEGTHYEQAYRMADAMLQTKKEQENDKI